MNTRTKFRRDAPITIYVIVFLISAACIIPFLMVISGSLSTQKDIMEHGYSLIPRNVTFVAYQVLFMKIDIILQAYKITFLVTIIGTVASLLINAMVAYTISRKSVKYRNAISVYCLITILFSGGMVPWYIVCINYFHLKDQLIALIVPYLANAWYIFLLRNFIGSIPEELHESAKIDGAGEMRTFAQIILPLSKPALATIGLFIALGYWNDWWLALMLVDDEKLRPIQFLLRVIVSNIQFLQSQIGTSEIRNLTDMTPTEGLKMATCILTIGPIIFLYPLLQRYFVKGIMVGAIKG